MNGPTESIAAHDLLDLLCTKVNFISYVAMSRIKDEENQQPDENNKPVRPKWTGYADYVLDIWRHRDRNDDLPPMVAPPLKTQLQSLFGTLLVTPLKSVLLSHTYNLLARLTESSEDGQYGNSLFMLLCLWVSLSMAVVALRKSTQHYKIGLHKVLNYALPYLLPSFVARVAVNVILLGQVYVSINSTHPKLNHVKELDRLTLVFLGLFLVVDIASAVKTYILYNSIEWKKTFRIIFHAVKIVLLILTLLDMLLNLEVYDGWVVGVCVVLISLCCARLLSGCLASDDNMAFCGICILVGYFTIYEYNCWTAWCPCSII